VEGAGYNAWAESNRLIVLYPQTMARSGRGGSCAGCQPEGLLGLVGLCVDYATRNGPQMAAVRKMVPAGRAPGARAGRPVAAYFSTKARSIT
jgi:poly(3-hydroxybutyrate) depolymerase